MARNVRLSLTVTVPETVARDVLSEMGEHAAELLAERGATYLSLDASDEEPVSSATRVGPGSRLFVVGPDREYEVTGLGTEDERNAAELTLRAVAEA